jgi:hypothetical protein
MGYSSRVDVLLQRDDGTRRLWIEFEVSRADPVANHAKFSVAHLFQKQLEHDAFVSMISPRVEYGRTNLAGNMVTLMRTIGMQAFQTLLIPYVTVQPLTISSRPLSVGWRCIEIVLPCIAVGQSLSFRRRGFTKEVNEFRLEIYNIYFHISRWGS